jgi:thiamine-phosphate pyrophosphorylase
MICHFECYFFLKNFSLEIEKKILKNKIKNIILSHPNDLDYTYIKNVRQWCKNKKIKFFIVNDYKLALRLKADGVYLTSNYKLNNNIFYNKIRFLILGSAHNQKDFFFKERQGCKKIFLSPIFKTAKYSINKILGLSKFNLICLNWKIPVVSLGGINLLNLKKIKLTKNKSIGFVKLIEEI